MSNELKNSSDKNVTVLPSDVKLIQTMLENAELYGEEEIYLDDITSITLENGIKFEFGVDGNLESVEAE